MTVTSPDWTFVAAPAPEGRVSLEGVVISAKEFETDYDIPASVWKMKLRVDNKEGTWFCHVSVPRSIILQWHKEAHEPLDQWLLGKTVALTATLRRKGPKNQHIAIGKRPRNAGLVQKEK